jgi:hypothetical protein
MSYRATPGGCCKSSDRNLNERHWGHWRWLQCLPQHRYARALALWRNLYHVRPRGLIVNPSGGTRLNMESS